MRGREDLHPFRRAPEQRVEIPGDVAEIVGKRRHARVPGGEDEALVDLHTGCRHQAPIRLVHIGRQVLVVAGGDEPAVDRVAPAVIGADEMPGVARLSPAQLGAAVAAGVEQNANLPVAPAHRDHGDAPHGAHDIVAPVGDFADVGDKDPEPVEYPVELQAEHVLADEGFALDGSVRRIDPGTVGRGSHDVVHASPRDSLPPASRRRRENCIIAAKIVSGRRARNGRARAAADSKPPDRNGVPT